MEDTDWEQTQLRTPSCRLQMDLRPYERGYEWVVTEFAYERRKWVVLSSGSSPHFAAACADLGRAVADVGAEAF